MCTLHSPSSSATPTPQIWPQEGVETLGAILRPRGETWFVSVRVAAAHVYVLTSFRGKFGNCFDGSGIARWQLLQNLLQIWTIGNITGTTTTQAPSNKLSNTQTAVIPDQAATTTWIANLEINEIKGTLTGLLNVECSPQNGLSYGEDVCTRTSPQWICKNVGGIVQWNRYGTCQTRHFYRTNVWAKGIENSN